MKTELQKIKEVLAKQKIRHYEIFVKQSQGTTIEVKDLKLNALENQNTIGFGLRIVENQRVGFGYGTDFSDTALDSIVHNTRSTALVMEVNPFFQMVQKMDSLPGLKNRDQAFESITALQRLQTALALEEEARRFDPRIQRVRYATYSDSKEETLLVNSAGLEASFESTGFSISLMAVAEEGEESETSFESFYSPFFSDLNSQALAQLSASQAVALLGGKRIPNYRGPVIMNQQVGGEMLEVLSPSMTAENVHKKNSFLIGKMGKKIYADSVTLIDNGLYPKGEATQPIDDEGTPCQETLLIERGVVKALLYDRTWGKKEGTPSTGNAFREKATSVPQLTSSNFYLHPGSDSQEALMKKMGNGLLITEVIGMHTADPISGDFSVGVQGFEVKQGKKGPPFRSVALTDNLHHIFSKIIAVADDLKFFGSTGSPSFLVEEASVSGA